MNERFAKLIKYLIAESIIKNQGEASAFFGYNSKTTISNIINSKAKMPSKLLLLIEAKLPNVNMRWLKSGLGDMFNEDYVKPTTIVTSSQTNTIDKTQALEQRVADLELVIKTQERLLSSKDEIITLLKKQK